MFTLCYYDAIMMLLCGCYAAINLSCYYAALFCYFKSSDVEDDNSHPSAPQVADRGTATRYSG